MNDQIIKNGLIGGTVASGASLFFFAFQRVRIAIPYVWSWAVLAALAYGFLATKPSIYGKGSTVFSNWRNVLLTLALFIVAEVGSLNMYPIFRISPETSTAVALAVLASMTVRSLSSLDKLSIHHRTAGKISVCKSKLGREIPSPSTMGFRSANLRNLFIPKITKVYSVWNKSLANQFYLVGGV